MSIEEIERHLKETADSVVAPPDCYYLIPSKDYALRTPDGRFIRIDEKALRRHLISRGYSKATNPGQVLPSIDFALNKIETEQAVDYCGPVAGYEVGMIESGGAKLLVTRAPSTIEPAEGDWSTIRLLVEGLFGNDPIQVAIFYAWLHVAVVTLRSHRPRPGQVIILVGPRDCGKSLLQNEVVTPLLGGRSARPYQFATNSTPFNADLVAAEHLVMEDEQPFTDMRHRLALGIFMKQIAANEFHRLHAKHRDAIIVQPFWRLTMSVNDDPEHLDVLPSLDDPTIGDKVIALSCSKPSKPLNDGSAPSRKVYLDKLRLQLPAFVEYLLTYKIPDDIVGTRYGVMPFVHPSILANFRELSDEAHLVELIDMAARTPFFPLPHTDSAEGIQSRLQNTPAVQQQVKALAQSPSKFAKLLGRLAESRPDRVKQASRVNNKRQWTIHSPTWDFSLPPSQDPA